MANLLIDVLRQYNSAGKFTVHEFVVMRNHFHALLKVPAGETIERAVQLIKGGFSYRAKKELGFNGEIWQKGFSDVRITDAETLGIGPTRTPAQHRGRAKTRFGEETTPCSQVQTPVCCQ